MEARVEMIVQGEDGLGKGMHEWYNYSYSNWLRLQCFNISNQFGLKFYKNKSVKFDLRDD